MTIYWLLSGRVGFEHSFSWGQGTGGEGEGEKGCPLSQLLCTLSKAQMDSQIQQCAQASSFKATTVTEFL